MNKLKKRRKLDFKQLKQHSKYVFLKHRFLQMYTKLYTCMSCFHYVRVMHFPILCGVSESVPFFTFGGGKAGRGVRRVRPGVLPACQWARRWWAQQNCTSICVRVDQLNSLKLGINSSHLKKEILILDIYKYINSYYWIDDHPLWEIGGL